MKQTEEKTLLLQMKADLEVARKIAKQHQGEDIESLILSGIFMGRELENQRIKDGLLLSGIKLPNNLNGILFKLKS